MLALRLIKIICGSRLIGGVVDPGEFSCLFPLQVVNLVPEIRNLARLIACLRTLLFAG